MGFYDSGKTHRHTIYNTQFQEEKLKAIKDIFHKSNVDLWTEFLDRFYCEYLDITSGRVNYQDAMKMAVKKLIDDYIDLRRAKGLVPPLYPSRDTKEYFARSKLSE